MLVRYLMFLMAFVLRPSCCAMDSSMYPCSTSSCILCFSYPVYLRARPCGSLGQPSMDTLLEIVKENDLSPGDINEIRLRAGPNILEPLRYEKPVNALQAKFSLHFGLSSILLNRKAGLREYTDDYVKNPKVREMMDRVKTLQDPEIAAIGTD